MTVVLVNLRTANELSVPISWHSNPRIVCIGSDTQGSFESSGAVSYTTVPARLLMEEEEFDAQMDAFTDEKHDYRIVVSSGFTTAAESVSTLSRESKYYEMSLSAATSMFAHASTPPAKDTRVSNPLNFIKAPYHPQSCNGDRLEIPITNDSYDDGSTDYDNVYEEEECEMDGADYC